MILVSEDGESAALKLISNKSSKYDHLDPFHSTIRTTLLRYGIFQSNTEQNTFSFLEQVF